MYVCLCMGVTDKQIRKEVNEGCCSLQKLQDTLGVGITCGQCIKMVQQIQEEEFGKVAESANKVA